MMAQAPPDGSPGTPFRGFQADTELQTKMQGRKLTLVEQIVNDLIDRVRKLEKRSDDLQKENEMLKAYCLDLNAKLAENQEDVKKQENKVREIKEEHKEWRKEKEEEKISFQEIMQSQSREKTDLTSEIVKVIKQKESMVRDTVDKKKCIVIYGLKEETEPIRTKREKEQRMKVDDVVRNVQGEEDEWVNEIEEVHRLGKYKEGESRPLKVKFRAQSTAVEVISNAWKLDRVERYKKVWIKRDMNEEERQKINELIKEAKEKNENRTEEEKKKFYWKVKD